MQSDVANIQVSSGRRLLGWSTAYGYQTSVWLWRLRLHIFWREDPGEAFHDHPWGFTTWPLVSYVEEVLDPATGATSRRVVPRWRPSYRPALHAHRVLGASSKIYDVLGNPLVRPGAVVTLCWRGRHERDWDYLLVRGSKVWRFPWRRYLLRVDNKPRST